MNPAPFAYHRPATLAEAISLLQTYADDAKVLAGGHSLLPVMKLRLAEPGHLIDIGRLPALRGVRQEGDTLVIGALTTHRDLEREPLVRERCRVLAATAAVVGDRQVRARGTLGGALCHADPAADEPAAILALDATLVAQGPNGRREIPATEFFVGFLTTALAPDEVVTEIRIPALPERTGTNYQKLANQASGYAIVGVAAIVTLGPDGSCREARIAVTGAGDHPVRASAAEELLRGGSLDAQTIAAASAAATEGIDFLDDLHASAAYRRRVLQGLTTRAIIGANQ